MKNRKSYNVAGDGAGEITIPLKDIGDKKPIEIIKGRKSVDVPDDNDDKTASVRATDKVELKREVTLMNGIGIIVGSIIGSGIFLTPSSVYSTAPDPYGAMGVWAGCGVFSLIGALCFAELGTCIDRSGGDYAYILEAFGPLPGFLTLWVTVLVIRPTTAAIIAITFAKYAIKPAFLLCNGPEEPEILLATTCLCLLTAINCMSVKLTMKIQDIFTAAKLIALTIIIVTGFIFLILGEFTEDAKKLIKDNSFNNPYQYAPGESFKLINISLSFYYGLFGYAGWNYLNFVTKELKNPYRDLPRAIWIGLPLVTIVYVLANASYFIILSPQEMTSRTVAVSFGGRTFGTNFEWLIPLFVALSTFGGVNGTLFTSARLFFAGAEEKQLPEILACVHVKRFTPVPALLVSCLISIIYLCIGEIDQLLSYVSFVLWVSTGVAVAALLWLRRTQPNLHRPIKVPLILPCLYIIFTKFLVLSSVYADPYSTGVGTLITLTGVPVYLIMVWARKNPNFGSKGSCTQTLTTFLQKLLSVIPQEHSEALI